MIGRLPNESSMSKKKNYLHLKSHVNPHDVSREHQPSDNYSEAAINRQFLKLVSFVLWFTMKHMYATCSGLRASCLVSSINGIKEEKKQTWYQDSHISAVSMKQEAHEELQLRDV